MQKKSEDTYIASRTFTRPYRQRATCHSTADSLSCGCNQENTTKDRVFAYHSVAGIRRDIPDNPPAPTVPPKQQSPVPSNTGGRQVWACGSCLDLCNSFQFLSGPQIEPPRPTVPWIVAEICIAELYLCLSKFTRGVRDQVSRIQEHSKKQRPAQHHHLFRTPNDTHCAHRVSSRYILKNHITQIERSRLDSLR